MYSRNLRKLGYSTLGLVLARKEYDVTLWEFNQERAEEIQRERENKRFLPGVKFPDNLKVTNKKEGLLAGIKYVVFSVPSQVLRKVIGSFSNDITEDMLLVNTAKGIEFSTGMRLSEVIKDEIFGKYHNNIVVFSGPYSCRRSSNRNTNYYCCSWNTKMHKNTRDFLIVKNFRVYLNEDITGVEIGAAVKNCLAIGAGIADGMGFGDNTKAALITRGIAEMTRFGKACGAKEITFSGLSGIGDLIVTCASKHSRNRHVGE